MVLPSFFEVALKIGAPTAENVNWFAHNSFNLANLHPLSSRTDVGALAKSLRVSIT